MSIERASQATMTPNASAASPSWLPPAEFGTGLRERNEASIARLLEVRDPTEAFHELLDALVSGPWSFGAIWTLQENEWSCVSTSARVNEATVTLSQLGVSAGPTLLDRAARAHKVVFRRWLPIDASCPLEAAARKAGFVSAAAYALTGANTTLGVVTVFSKKERRPEHFGTAEQNLVRCAGLMYAVSTVPNSAVMDSVDGDLLDSADYEVDSGVFQNSNALVEADDEPPRAADALDDDATFDDAASLASLIPSLLSAPFPRPLDDDSTAFSSSIVSDPDQVARAVHAVSTAIAQLTATLLGTGPVAGSVRSYEQSSESSAPPRTTDPAVLGNHDSGTFAATSRVDGEPQCVHFYEGATCSDGAKEVVDPVSELRNYARHLLTLVQ